MKKYKTNTYKQISHSSRFIILLLATSLLFTITSCQYNELPPKTSDSTSDFILPKGEVPTPQDLETLRLIKEEYNNSTK